jgi:hypothetical protein
MAVPFHEHAWVLRLLSQVIHFRGGSRCTGGPGPTTLLPEHAMREDGISTDTKNIEAPWKIARS